MKKLLLIVLAGVSINSFAVVGDIGSNGSGNSYLVNATDVLKTQVSLLNPNNETKFLSFSNSKNKLIKQNFSNIDKTYSIIQLDNDNAYKTLQMSVFADANGVANGKYYQFKGGYFGNAFDYGSAVNSIDFTKLLNKFKAARPTYDLTRLTRITVHAERDAKGLHNMVGFVFAPSDDDLKHNTCAEFGISADGKDISQDVVNQTGCFDI